MLRTNILASLALIFVTGVANAQIRLGQPSYGGSGCPAGSASATLSPDQSTLSILFDQFISEAGGPSGRRVDQKSCNIAVPVNLPQGYSVSLIAIDYRGYASIPRGGRGRFAAEYFFAGERGPRFTKEFSGGYDSDYLFENDMIAEALVWSACGASVNLRVNASLVVQSNTRNEQALATVDSADIDAGIIYHVRWRRC